jgi:cytochrome c556
MSFRIPDSPKLVVTMLFAAMLAGAACSSRPPPRAIPDEDPHDEPTDTDRPVATVPTPIVVAPDRPEVEDDAALLRLVMKIHFQESVLIRRAIMDGDIDGAIAPAREIAGWEAVDDLPDPWRTRIGEMQHAAGRIRNSPDLPEAAAAVADIGKSCAGCHLEMGGPSFDVPTMPASDSLVERMKRHVWSSERLWEGLVGPSDAAWKAGAEALALAPLPTKALAPGGVHAKSLSGRFAMLAKQAAAADDLEARATTYGSLLATCAPCHQAVGRSPTKP